VQLISQLQVNFSLIVDDKNSGLGTRILFCAALSSLGWAKVMHKHSPTTFPKCYRHSIRTDTWTCSSKHCQSL